MKTTAAFSPKPETAPSRSKIPLWINVLYTLFLAVLIPVYWTHGFSDTQAQQWMPQEVYLFVWMFALLALAYLPTSVILERLFGNTSAR